MAHIKGEKIWAEAVRKAVHDYHESEDETGKTIKTRWLNMLAETLVKKAASGDTIAMKEVGDRLDGKPAQSVDTTINDNRTTAELSSQEVLDRAESLIGRLERVERPPGRNPRKRASSNGSADVH